MVSSVLLIGSPSVLVLCDWSLAVVLFYFFLCLAPRVGVGFWSSVAVVSFLLNFGLRLVLVLVVPQGVGFGLSRFALVLVVCGGFVLFSPLIAWCWSSQATK